MSSFSPVMGWCRPYKGLLRPASCNSCGHFQWTAWPLWARTGQSAYELGMKVNECVMRCPLEAVHLSAWPSAWPSSSIGFTRLALLAVIIEGPIRQPSQVWKLFHLKNLYDSGDINWWYLWSLENSYSCIIYSSIFKWAFVVRFSKSYISLLNYI